MKQPEDSKTIDMIDQAKRGRGRPRVEQPLTPAERARRYRENQAKRKALMVDIRDDDADTKKMFGRYNQYGNYYCEIHGWNCAPETCFDLVKTELAQLRSRDEQPVTKSSDQVFLLELKIQQLEADLASYRQYQEQRADLDHMAQRQFDQVNEECEALREQNSQLSGIVSTFIYHKDSKKGMASGVYRNLVATYKNLVVSR